MTRIVVDPYTDPNELFDLYSSDGRPTGRVKRRADVHRDGDWHRSFHCWVTCLAPSDAPPLLILQRRGGHKDTWPGRLDASVGGHYRAGETLSDVVREVEEEIGQPVRLEELIPLGHRVSVSDSIGGPVGAVQDRELQDVFLWRSPFPLASFRPQPVEVAALEGVAVSDLLRLLSGAVEAIPTLLLPAIPAGMSSDPPGAGTEGGAHTEGPPIKITQATITREDFIPTFDRYFYRVAAVVDLAWRGYPHLTV